MTVKKRNPSNSGITSRKLWRTITRKWHRQNTKVFFSVQLTWLNTTILVLLDLGVDLVKSGVSRVLATRNTRRDIVVLMKVVPQCVSWVRIALREREREKREKRDKKKEKTE